MLLKLASALGFAALAHAQTASAWYDDVTGVTFRRYYNADVDTTWGYIFPPSTGATDEFVGIFQAPASAGWMGNSLGGGMRNAPLLLGWVDSGNPKLSVRWATDYAPPVLYGGPRLTILGSSGTDGTVQRIVYRCQNCTTWTGGTGGVPLNGTTVLGYAFNTAKPTNPSDATSPVSRHTLASQFGLDLRTGRSSSYTFFLQELTNAPPLSGSAGPVEPPIISTTTSSSSTSTTSSSSTTSTIPTTSSTITTPTTTPTTIPSTTSTRPITSTSSGIPLPSPTTGTGQWWDALTNVTFRRYYSAELDTTWGYLFPASNVSSTDEFIGIFQAPATAGYIGNSLGQGMRNNPLILGWVDGDQPRVSARWATDYAPPVPLAGPRLTILGSSGTDGTVQRIVYRCQGCTTWNGGSIPLTGSTVLGYAFGSQPPVDPSDPYSGVFQHSAQGLHSFSLLTGRSASYTWYLEQLMNAPPLSGSTGPIPQPTIGTTISPPTSTVPTITTTPTSSGPTITGPITTTSQGPVPTIGATAWYDALTNVTFRRYYNSETEATFGYIFPASNVSSTDEFIGILQAPVSAGYIGNSLGPSMKNNLLLAAWVDAGQPRISARWATDYAPPVPLAGPRLTILGSSGTDGTIQRIVYRCQGCTAWSGGGGVPVVGTHVMGFVLGSQPPIDPSDPYSGLNKHSMAGLHAFSMLTGRSASYTFYLDELMKAAPLSGTTGPIPQPSGGTTVTPTMTTTPTTTPTSMPTTTPTLTPPPSSATTSSTSTTIMPPTSTSQVPIPTISAGSWYDAVTNVTFRRYYNSNLQATYGYIFPPTNASTDEFIGIFQAPVVAGYLGNSLGPGMRNNPLIVGWVDGTTPRVSARWATEYAPPAAYTGPRLTILGSSGSDGTIQRIVYRCQNCTTWSGGSVLLTGTHVMGFVYGADRPVDPSNPNSGVYKHTIAGLHAYSMLTGRSASYSFYLDELTKAPPFASAKNNKRRAGWFWL